MKVLQINGDRRSVAMDLARATASKHEATLICVSEPNIAATKGARWFRDVNASVAIGFNGPNPGIVDSNGGNGFVWVKTEDYKVYSCYISPNINIQEYEIFCSGLADDIRADTATSKVIVTGDFNAKSPQWGGNVAEDRKGQLISLLVASLDFTILNVPGQPTFWRGDSRSVIDLTFVSQAALENLCGWSILEEDPLSPHKYILSEFISGRSRRQPFKWKFGPIMPAELNLKINSLVSHQTDVSPETLVTVLSKAYIDTTPRVRVAKNHVPYWWTDTISNLRADALARRRRVTRARARRRRDPAEINTVEVDFKAARKALKIAILKSKKECWNKICSDLESDIFGQGYKIIMRSTKHKYPSCTISREEKIRQANLLFPDAPVNAWTKGGARNPNPLTAEELAKAIAKLKPGRSPGLDRIPAEVFKATERTLGPYLLKVFNRLLSAGEFPEIWKRAKLVLIEKARIEHQANPPSFRPICIIDSAAKLYENIINSRLVQFLEEGQKLSERQFGFRKGRSTVDAVNMVMEIAKRANRAVPREWCAIITLDIKNAFNSIRWPKIINALVEKDVPEYLLNLVKAYLSDRSIVIDHESTKPIYAGVPQGSVLGPTLWNVAYDAILRLEVPSHITLIGFADDIAIVATDRRADQLEQKIADTLTRIQGWLDLAELELAPHKTEACLLKGARRENITQLQWGANTIMFKSEIKYLGVMLDSRLSFCPHIKRVAAKAENTVSALCKLLPNIGGPSETRRRVLSAVAHSILLYAAPVWSGAMRVQSYRAILSRVQRRMVLRVCRGYITVSTDAALVLSSVPPIHLLAWERQELYDAGANTAADIRMARERLLDKWQQEWTASPNGQWTRTLIENLRPWVRRPHGSVNFHLTQALSNHGCFKAYTYRIKRSRTDICRYCPEVDTAGHTLFVCVRWDEERNRVNNALGITVSEDNVIPLMLESKRKWDMIEAYVISVMTQKVIDERVDQARQQPV